MFCCVIVSIFSLLKYSAVRCVHCCTSGKIMAIRLYIMFSIVIWIRVQMCVVLDKYLRMCIEPDENVHFITRLLKELVAVCVSVATAPILSEGAVHVKWKGSHFNDTDMTSCPRDQCDP